MELVLSRPGMLRTFTMEWSMKWVPAVVAYSKNLKRKEVKEIFSQHESSEFEGEMVYIIHLVCIR